MSENSEFRFENSLLAYKFSTFLLNSAFLKPLSFFEIEMNALRNHNLKLCACGEASLPHGGCMDISEPSLQVVYRLSALAHCTAVV